MLYFGALKNQRFPDKLVNMVVLEALDKHKKFDGELRILRCGDGANAYSEDEFCRRSALEVEIMKFHYDFVDL